jgi:hypothetical protein
MMTKRFALTMLVAALLSGVPVAAQDAAQIAAVRKTFEEAGTTFLGLIQNLTEEQWKFKPAGAHHSVGDEAEHVALSENDLQHVILQAMKGPVNREAAKLLAGKEKRVKEMMLNPETQAENYKPKGKLKTQPEVVEYFTRAHDYALNALQKTPELSLHVLGHPHKDYNDLTAYQWYYYIAYHTLRHCKQIEQITADASFPGGPRKSAKTSAASGK